MGNYSPTTERRCVLCVYSNAADVLPPDLLRKVQKHWRGLLYVPPVMIPPRNEETGVIRSMILSGTPVSEIAASAPNAEMLEGIAIQGKTAQDDADQTR